MFIVTVDERSIFIVPVDKWNMFIVPIRDMLQENNKRGAMGLDLDQAPQICQDLFQVVPRGFRGLNSLVFP